MTELSMTDPARPRGLRELDEIDTVFKALSHTARRHVLQVLYARQGAMTAGELASRFAHSWPTTTRHLDVLCHAGLIKAERRGRERHYVLNQPLLRTVTDRWLAGVGLAVGPAATRETPARRRQQDPHRSRPVRSRT
jgi:DNA-binding transcriptional ArsR family regulator